MSLFSLERDNDASSSMHKNVVKDNIMETSLHHCQNLCIYRIQVTKCVMPDVLQIQCGARGLGEGEATRGSGGGQRT